MRKIIVLLSLVAMASTAQTSNPRYRMDYLYSYLNAYLTSGTSHIPDTTLKHSLGADTSRWRSIYVRSAFIDSILSKTGALTVADSLTITGYTRIDDTLNVGNGTPLSKFHVNTYNAPPATTSTVAHNYYVFTGVSEDAVIGLISKAEGGHGSGVDLIEVDSVTGALINKWWIGRNSTPSGSPASLDFMFGSNADYADNYLKMRLDSSGRLLINQPAVRGMLLARAGVDDRIMSLYSISNRLRFGVDTTGAGSFVNNGGPDMDLSVSHYSTNTAAATFIGRKARGTEESPSAVASGDVLAFFAGRGYHSGGAMGTANVGAFYIRADEAFTSSAQGASARIGTAQTGSTTRTDRVIVDAVANRARFTLGTTAGTGAGRMYAGDSLYTGTTLRIDGSGNLVNIDNATIGGTLSVDSIITALRLTSNLNVDGIFDVDSIRNPAGAVTVDDSLSVTGTIQSSGRLRIDATNSYLGTGLGLVGTASGATNISLFNFANTSQGRVGYLGDASTGDRHIYLRADSGNIVLIPALGLVDTQDTLNISSGVLQFAGSTAIDASRNGTLADLNLSGGDLTSTAATLNLGVAGNTINIGGKMTVDTNTTNLVNQGTVTATGSSFLAKTTGVGTAGTAFFRVQNVDGGSQGYFGKASTGNQHMYVRADSGHVIFSLLAAYSVVPETDNSTSLGSATLEWDTTFTEDAVISNNLALNGTFSTDLRPSATGKDIGTSGTRLDTIYTEDIDASGFVQFGGTNTGTATLGAGDSVQVTLTGFTSSGVVIPVYTSNTKLTTSEIPPSVGNKQTNKFTIFGSNGKTVDYFVVKK